MDAWITLRRKLHAQAETAGHESETARTVAAALPPGAEIVAQDLAGHGLLARIGAGRPHLLLRADLDALPMEEATGRPYAATKAHHACGHDGHMAMLLAALNGWDVPCTLWVLFQPSEETGEGMAACLADERFPTDLDGTVAFHNVPGHPLGTVIVPSGTAAVASTGLVIRWQGATSHAAEPEAGRNPIPLASRLVLATQEASKSWGEGAVVAFVEIQGGGPRFGTSAGDCLAAMTLRARTDQELDAMVDQVTRLAQDAAEGTGITVDAAKIEPFTATVNDADAVAVIRTAAKTCGLDVVDPGAFPWSEDFGRATARWPGALVGIGSGTDHPPLHSKDYDFPDDLLQPGRDLWRAIVGRWTEVHNGR